MAESIGPTVHAAYWQQNHASQPYSANGSYDQYRDAYRTGYQGVGAHGADKPFSEVESDLKSKYEQGADKAGVAWEHAKEATRAAYDHARDSVKKAWSVSQLNRSTDLTTLPGQRSWNRRTGDAHTHDTPSKLFYYFHGQQ